MAHWYHQQTSIAQSQSMWLIIARKMTPDPEERLKALRLMYNVRCTVNPLNGEQYGPNSLGLLSEVVKIFTDEGQVKGWRVRRWRERDDS